MHERCKCGHDPVSHFGGLGYGCDECPNAWCAANEPSVLPDGWLEAAYEERWEMA